MTSKNDHSTDFDPDFPIPPLNYFETAKDRGVTPPKAKPDDWATMTPAERCAYLGWPAPPEPPAEHIAAADVADVIVERLRVVAGALRHGHGEQRDVSVVRRHAEAVYGLAHELAVEVWALLDVAPDGEWLRTRCSFLAPGFEKVDLAAYADALERPGPKAAARLVVLARWPELAGVHFEHKVDTVREATKKLRRRQTPDED